MKKIFSLFLLMLLMAGFSAKAENEIYAVLDLSTTTVTLYYDDQMESRGGVTDWYERASYRGAISFVLDDSMKDARPTSTRKWFNQFAHLVEIQHLEYLNTSEVTDMFGMFGGSSALTTVNLQSFDISNVTEMSCMFQNCTNLTTIYCNDNWSTTTATSIIMFLGCTSLVGGNNTSYDPNHTDASYARLDEPGQQGYFTYIEIVPELYALYDAETTTMTLYYDGQMLKYGGFAEWWDDLPTEDITTVVLDGSMQDARPTSTRLWFQSCNNLTEIQHLDYLNTSEVTDMSIMFRYCYRLTSVDLRSFDVTNVTDMRGMFEECQALKTIYCGGNWSATTANSERMFRGSMAIVGGNGTTYDSDHTDASYARLDEPGVRGYFALEPGPEVYAVYNAATTTMTLYYDNRCEENGGSTAWWNDLPTEDITTVTLDESMQDARPTSTRLWFQSCPNLTEIQHLDYLNTSEVTDMAYMFRYCYVLTSVDLRSFDVTNVTDMYGMFQECSALKTIYCGGNWSATTADTRNMFEGCMALVGGNGTTYDPDHTDASYARLDEPGTPGYFALDVAPEIYAIYEDATGILTLYFNKQREEQGGIPQERWNELPNEEVLTVVLDESMKNARPRSTSGWFYYFTRLREIQHLDYLNTSEVTDMSIMFRNCERITTLDLRSFDITKVTSMRLMFMDCAALKTIYCNDDWSTTTADSESMFKGCTSIVGGNGTTYDANHEDASYARYDEPGAPGYFTKKTATGIDQTTNDERLTTNKLLRDGQLLILRDGKMYNVMGGEVR